MAKLKVTAFKKSGKYYTDDVYNIEDYPSIYSSPQNLSIEQLRNLQSKFCYDLWESIKKGDNLKYCPVSDWTNFVFIFEGIFEDSESGFLYYLLDKSGE